jgi:uncharacterized protein YgbK (DUF1537 family)
MEYHHTNVPLASPSSIRLSLQRALAAAGARVVVVDDDPTGIQTVRDVPLITSWSQAEIAWVVSAADPIGAILTNSRALPEPEAVTVGRTVGERLARASTNLGVPVRVISRSDSTLRGHFPGEVTSLIDGLAAGGLKIDGVLVCAAFPEAGRITSEDVHRIRQGDRFVPVAETEFAQDPVFGYRSSNLIEWVSERCGGPVAVGSVTLDELRGEDPLRVADRLEALFSQARYVVANAVTSGDLDALAMGVELAEQRGLRIVSRTAPSFVAARAGLGTAEPLPDRRAAARPGPGLVVVGSHTALTTAQLRDAQRNHRLEAVPLDVSELVELGPEDRTAMLRRVAARLVQALSNGDAALITSRRLIRSEANGKKATTATAAGAWRAEHVSRVTAEAVVEVVAATITDIPLAWVVTKGGITSHDIATRAFRVHRATVLGQLFHGTISIWELGARSARPGLRYVVFPGNVGDARTLTRTLDRIKGAS